MPTMAVNKAHSAWQFLGECMRMLSEDRRTVPIVTEITSALTDASCTVSRQTAVPASQSRQTFQIRETWQRTDLHVIALDETEQAGYHPPPLLLTKMPPPSTPRGTAVGMPIGTRHDEMPCRSLVFACGRARMHDRQSRDFANDRIRFSGGRWLPQIDRRQHPGRTRAAR